MMIIDNKKIKKKMVLNSNLEIPFLRLKKYFVQEFIRLI